MNADRGGRGDRVYRPHVVLLSDTPALTLRAVYVWSLLNVELSILSARGDDFAASSRFVSKHRRVDLHDPEVVRAAFRDLGGDLLSAADVPSHQALARVRALDPELPTTAVASERLLDDLDNKMRFDLLARRHGLPIPESTHLRDAADVDALDYDGLSFPLVVKSLYSESGKGVFVARDADDCRQYLASGRRYTEPPLVLQAFVSGDTACLNVFCRSGRVLACDSYLKRDEDHFEFVDLPGAVTDMSTFLTNIGFSGFANFDAIRDADGRFSFLECNPRVWYTIGASAAWERNYMAVALADAKLGPPLEFAPVGGAQDFVQSMALCKGLLRFDKRSYAASSASFRALRLVLGDFVAQYRSARG